MTATTERTGPARPDRPRAGHGRPARRRRAVPSWLGALGWAALGAIVVAVFIPTMVIEPMLPVLGAMGLALLLVAAFLPRAFALIALATIVLSVPLQGALGPVGRNADELVVMVALVAFTARRFVTERRIVGLPGWPWFAVFAVAGVASSLLREIPGEVWSEGLLLAVKGLLFAFALAQVEWRDRDLRVLVRAGVVAIVLLALTAVGNLVMPVQWATTFTGRPPVDYYGGIPSLSGPFQHPAAFGRLAAVFAVAVFAYRYAVRSSAWNAVLLVLSAGMALLTFRVKSLVGLIAAIGALALRFARPNLIWVVLAFGPLLALVLVPPLLEFVGADVDLYLVEDSARGTITMGSLDVAAGYFPFGAGFGRYGSFTASEVYSPEYVIRGFDHIYGLGRGADGRFLNDTQWPAIIGETGWVGTIGFAIGVAVAGWSLLRPVAGESSLVRWVRLCGVGWLVLLITESIAAPVFGSAPAYPFVFGAVGVIASIRRSKSAPAAIDLEPGSAFGQGRSPGPIA
ncbi:hypothetical protein FLP10_06920 [Agromyces intestinalis]|uniref:O-antigen ligase domain-containing protein n=1 Tax=Agromyces intestinalis TaxID=2592652 RepID=A0A5C1YDJ9_9MICO|nr:hypothetical protein [Agromyces intestinalis]QEO14181.1 hypothetical protein FLP10_06920 [Agromyces intestinalis]